MVTFVYIQQELQQQQHCLLFDNVDATFLDSINRINPSNP